MPLPLLTILIAGTSHVGKSTLAGLLSEKLGCEAISTDSLARHPGRPWPGIPAPVEDYYTQLSAETIHWFLKVHHQNIWPLIRSLIDNTSGTGNPAIFEGAALRPEFISPLLGGTVAGVFLHAGNDFLLERMRSRPIRRCNGQPAADHGRLHRALAAGEYRDAGVGAATSPAGCRRHETAGTRNPRGRSCRARGHLFFVIKRREIKVSSETIAASICPVTTR